MRILLLVHPDFYDAEPQRPLSEIRGWLHRYAEALRARGHQVEKFRGREVKVRDFEWVHCFSSVEAETWVGLQKAGCRVCVTPSLAAEPDRDFRRQASSAAVCVERGLIRVARAVSQRRWPPVDEASFARGVDRFLVPSQPWNETLARAWRLERNRISILPQDPGRAAIAAEEAFGNI